MDNQKQDTSYIMKYDNEYEQYLLIREDGKNIEREEKKVIIEAVSNTMWKQYFNKLHEILDHIETIGTWKFPEKNKELFGYTNGVYFISVPYKPNMIKIGYTRGSFADRIRQFKKQDQRAKIIAVWLLDNQVELCEAALHMHFRKYCIEGEWFSEQPVLEWLETRRNNP